ncbi:hypothetical protein CFC21_064195 [Triticum aestivum]|uniref:Uncharacterized protein n=3 Tax=Triticum TaxID=4564 RepID=A0A9R0WII4_TRITD|nr:uncharacterized protein LOC119296944 [Triticum dicoccoides]XP_044384596.1 uncharacterized protein LOC123106513 [Triticum aestivum]KAF7056817.1 hypothetical protein CFC21_064195 [Triticum aestivum]VAI12960.1 unnamed protein product [Triticum turgidum subsp. durum]
MTDLAAPMNMKRKDVEVVASHGFSIFLDPKRIKLELLPPYGMDGVILDMMEDEEPPAHALTSAPTIVHDKVNIVSGGKSSERPLKNSEEQDAAAATPMDVEAEAQQHQPCRNAPFFSGFF